MSAVCVSDQVLCVTLFWLQTNSGIAQPLQKQNKSKRPVEVVYHVLQLIQEKCTFVSVSLIQVKCIALGDLAFSSFGTNGH